MSRDLPSLEEPAAGVLCPECGEQLRLAGFCGACSENASERQAELLLDRFTPEGTER